MKFKVWHIFFVLLALGLVSGGIAYAQRPKPSKSAPIKTMPAAEKSGEAFLKAGTSYYAVSSSFGTSASFFTPTIINSVSITIPAGMKADLIATFSGELGYEGTYGNGNCIGYFVVDNSQYSMYPGPLYLVDSFYISDGDFNGTTMQGYQTKVKQGNHTVNFVVYADENSDGNCSAFDRSLTVIANVYHK